MTDPPPAIDETLAPLIDAALHRYMARQARRFVPLLLALSMVILVAVFVSPKHAPSSATTAAGAGPAGTGVTTGSGASTAAADLGSTASGPAATAGTAASAAGSSGASGAHSATGAGATQGAGGEEVTGSLSGVARSGARCGPGVQQVTWTPYAPPCVARFAGANGGATSPGVTPTTITVTLRQTADWNAFYPSFSSVVADLQTFIDYFNKNYEFSGRKIVLKTYTGQGSLAAEASGQGQAGAQADAQTEKDLGSFADVGVAFRVFGTALADQGIMMLGDGFSAEYVFRQYSPFLYGNALEASADDFGHGAAATVCQRMAGMPAIFAGDPLTQRTKRVFGLLDIQQPDMKPAGDVFQQDARARCGISVTRADYDFNAATESQQAVSIVARMKAAGVTTLVTASDPLMFAQITLAAQQQNWHPEYVTLETIGFERDGDANQTSHAIKLSAFGMVPGTSTAQEPGRVFRLASGGAAPKSGGFIFPELYMNLLQFANAVQAAGPHLTPAMYLAAKRVLPDARGDFGLWKRTQLYDESADFVVSRFDPTATSPADGKAGVWKACNAGARYLNINPTMGSGQLGC